MRRQKLPRLSSKTAQTHQACLKPSLISKVSQWTLWCQRDVTGMTHFGTKSIISLEIPESLLCAWKKKRNLLLRRHRSSKRTTMTPLVKMLMVSLSQAIALLLNRLRREILLQTKEKCRTFTWSAMVALLTTLWPPIQFMTGGLSMTWSQESIRPISPTTRS